MSSNTACESVSSFLGVAALEVTVAHQKASKVGEIQFEAVTGACAGSSRTGKTESLQWTARFGKEPSSNNPLHTFFYFPPWRMNSSISWTRCTCRVV